MPEWLGRALQKLAQQFKSVWDLSKKVEMKKQTTVFRVKIFDDKNKLWKFELHFYNGYQQEFLKVNIENDWRFKELKGKREKAILVGCINLSEDDFPIKYPLILKNGVIIEK